MNLLKTKNIVLFFLALVTISCSKEEVVKDAELTAQEVKELVQVDDFLTSIYGISDVNRVSAKSANTKQKVSCMLQNVVDIDLGKKLTLDFGAGCDAYGKTYAGKMHINYEFVDGGYKSNFKFEGLSVDGIKVEGSLAFEATNSSVQFESNLIVTLASGKSLKREGTWSLEKTGGNATLGWGDDVYSMGGSWEATSSEGVTLAIKVEKNLVKKNSCAFISEGVIKITKYNTDYFVDFGDNTCDSKVTIKDSEGNVKEISL